jgi:hypothetical protein
MFAAGGFENGARELGADSASEDTLDRVAASIVPQLYSEGQVLLQKGGLAIRGFAFAPPALFQSWYHTRPSMLWWVRSGYYIVLVTKGYIPLRIIACCGVISGVSDAATTGYS